MACAVDTVGRFDDRAADYVRYRPTYPPEAIDAILEGLGPADRLVAADVGAGTGISARLLGDRGLRVIAIEPGLAMRGAAAAHANVAWVSATAEATGLGPASVDLVVCAQSFHWFSAPDALAEFARILKRAGRLAIVWNRRNAADVFTAGYRAAIREVGGDGVAAERMVFDPGALARSGLFSSAVRAAFPNRQRLDLEGLNGRARSASGVPKAGEAGARLAELLRELHEQHAGADGFVTLVYETELFRASKL